MTAHGPGHACETCATIDRLVAIGVCARRWHDGRWQVTRLYDDETTDRMIREADEGNQDAS